MSAKEKIKDFSMLHFGPWAQKGSIMDDMELIEISIVVRDLERSMRQFEEYFDMKPYYVSDVIEFSQSILRGNPNPGMKIRVAMYQTGPASNPGPVRIELLEPCGGNSIYQEFLDLKGQGVNHVGFKLKGKNLDQIVNRLESKGVKAVVRQPSSKYSGWKEGAYFDTLDSLGFFLETVEPVETSG